MSALTSRTARAFVSEHFGLTATRVRCVSRQDTIVWRVDTTAGVFTLRRHGTHTEAEIASVMMWLDALRDTDVRAPEPVRTRDGGWVVERCTLVSWIDGRMVKKAQHPAHYERLGRTMGQLHEHVATWTPPPAFTRPEWSAADVFCERGIAQPPSGDVWALVPAKHLDTFRRAADRARPALDGAERRLIHADLHHWNAIFADGLACPIDFDDCGIGALLYDVAAAIGDQRLKPIWPRMRDAFLRGYASVRPPPDVSSLDTFILARATGLALWATSLAETVPHFREPLPRWLAHYEDELTRLLELSGP
jgi:Ser/Thr protein kinase RdoA (MazF antagonist)